ncbi:MAG: hypothetical protein GC160_04080 [Acidobacteria bacterium]|nr:hypothetical protein [Acidobacteriota bacterium]
MRGFFTRRTPEASRILLIESGPRPLGELTIERLRTVFGSGTEIDAVHCQLSGPAGALRCWSVNEGGRWELLRALRREGHPTAALLAGGDPIMAPWRWAMLATLPAKFLVVNENGDFFWLDRGNLGTLVTFLQHRSGLGGESALRSAARIFLIPPAFCYLLVYAAAVHVTRWTRLALGLRRSPQVSAEARR